MPIRFSALFQDTWNFMRNRPHFVMYAVISLAALQIAISMLFPKVQLDLQAVQNSPEIAKEAMLGSLLPGILSLFAVMLVNVLLVLNINAINHARYSHFFQNVMLAIQRFLAVTLLSFIQFFPLSVGVSFLLMLGAESSLIALPLMITGLFVFVKLNLVMYTYLLEEPPLSIGQTLRFTWTMSQGNMMPLILFCALVYAFPMVLGGFLNAIQLALGEGIGHFIAQILGALINLTVTIFSFRFYQVYRQTVKGA